MVVPFMGMCDGRRVRVTGRLASAGVALVLLGAAGPARATPAEPAPLPRSEAVERARREVLDDDYQADLPRYQDSGADGASGPRRKAGGELGEAERERRAMLDSRAHGAGGALSSLMTFLMWGLVIVIGGLGVSWLISELAARGDEAGVALAGEPDRRGHAAHAAIIERPLGDADELARRGEFAEAIHALLLRTLQALARSAAVRVAPAMTSREVLARVPLGDEARAALAGLITAVEITHFGDEPASAADYARCREQFHVFATAFRGAGAEARAA